jgi:hypothetical protein
MTRSQMPARERGLRSRLAQLVHKKPLIRATLNVRHVTCGKSGCRCTQGYKHQALYLVCSTKGKKRQLFVPASMEQEVRRWVENYRSAMALLEKVSERTWGELKRRKEHSDI